MKAGADAGLFRGGDLLGTTGDPFPGVNGRAGLGDQRVGIDLAAAAELGDHVRVGAQRHRGAVAELLGELDDAQPPLVDAHAGEAVAQVVWARAEPACRRQLLEPALAPVAVVVLAPRLCAGRGYEELAARRAARSQVQLLEVVAKRVEQLDRARRATVLLA